MPKVTDVAGDRLWWNRPRGFGVAVVVLAGFCASLSAVRDRQYGQGRAETAVLYLSSGDALRQLALSFDAVLADVYWIRAIQHYGSTKLLLAGDARAPDPGVERAQYQLLYPLLDITTTLDPRFNVAYRFGAIFLTEAYPAGPGQPDRAIALLQKGFREMPDKWQYLMDIGFVHYWWLHNYEEAASWFRKASEVAGAPWWLKPLAATTLAQGGDRRSSQVLWQQMYDTADNEWLRNEAARRLTQLRALDEIDQLTAAVAAHRDRTGQPPPSWQALVAQGFLAGVPVDPTGTPYVLDGARGVVYVSPDSPLFPLPIEPGAIPTP